MQHKQIGNITKLAIVAFSISCLSPNNTFPMLGQPNYIEGIDISHHQGKIDWQQCTPERGGKQFIIAKATEGATYQDSMFAQNVSSARAAGFTQLGAYHFVRFGWSSPIEQMQNFISQIRGAGLLADQESILALDVEEHQGADYTLVQSVVKDCVHYLMDSEKIMPYIYTRTSFWDKYVAETPDIVKQCPLWIARWRANPPLAKELPRGWDDWMIWQYSNIGSVPGIAGKVDLNRMKW